MTDTPRAALEKALAGLAGMSEAIARGAVPAMADISATALRILSPHDSKIGPWRIWYDPPPIGARNCDWHYQHEDCDGPESPSWMTGHAASREACISDIVEAAEDARMERDQMALRLKKVSDLRSNGCGDEYEAGITAGRNEAADIADGKD